MSESAIRTGHPDHRAAPTDACGCCGGVTLSPAAQAFLLKAAERLGWSGRALHRVVKVARTIADLAAAGPIGVAHVAEAVQYRRALRQAG